MPSSSLAPERFDLVAPDLIDDPYPSYAHLRPARVP
jgi:hypothetical protein